MNSIEEKCMGTEGSSVHISAFINVIPQSVLERIEVKLKLFGTIGALQQNFNQFLTAFIRVCTVFCACARLSYCVLKVFSLNLFRLLQRNS